MGLSSQPLCYKIKMQEPRFLEASLSRLLHKCINRNFNLETNEASKVSSSMGSYFLITGSYSSGYQLISSFFLANALNFHAVEYLCLSRFGR